MAALVLACGLFGLGALGGLSLLALRLRGGNPPLGLALAHGLVVACALVALVVAVLGGSRGAALLALILFGLAGGGGFFLLSVHLRQRLLPVPFILAHAIVAASGFVALLFAVLA